MLNSTPPEKTIAILVDSVHYDPFWASFLKAAVLLEIPDPDKVARVIVVIFGPKEEKHLWSELLDDPFESTYYVEASSPLNISLTLSMAAGRLTQEGVSHVLIGSLNKELAPIVKYMESLGVKVVWRQAQSNQGKDRRITIPFGEGGSSLTYTPQLAEESEGRFASRTEVFMRGTSSR